MKRMHRPATSVSPENRNKFPSFVPCSSLCWVAQRKNIPSGVLYPSPPPFLRNMNIVEDAFPPLSLGSELANPSTHGWQLNVL